MRGKVLSGMLEPAFLGSHAAKRVDAYALARSSSAVSPTLASELIEKLRSAGYVK